jgi:hypothetical protein
VVTSMPEIEICKLIHHKDTLTIGDWSLEYEVIYINRHVMTFHSVL